MSPYFKSASKKIITQSIQKDRVAKHLTRDKIRIATHIHPQFPSTITSSDYSRTSDSVRTTNSSRTSIPLESDSIDRLDNILQDEFELLETQIRQANTTTFDQLMKRLDELSDNMDRSIASFNGIVKVALFVISIIPHVDSFINILSR